MKAYNPRAWGQLIFSFHKSDSFRQLLPAICGLSILCAILCLLHIEFGILNLRSTTVMHSLLGFVISLLLVFRTNTAYDRWWEGRRLWGELVNTSRNTMLKITSMLPAGHSADVERMRKHVSNFAFALKEHLRGGFKEEQIEEDPSLPISVLKSQSHIPNRIALQIYQEAVLLRDHNKISAEQFLMLNEELRAFANISGGCERIRKTPIPYSYSTFIKRMIFLYVVTLPFGLIPDLQWATIPLVIFVFYAFASLELIAEEIEDPFGHENNDLPTDELAATIKKNLLEITAAGKS
jgi:putative membrane protein